MIPPISSEDINPSQDGVETPDYAPSLTNEKTLKTIKEIQRRAGHMDTKRVEIKVTDNKPYTTPLADNARDMDDSARMYPKGVSVMPIIDASGEKWVITTHHHTHNVFQSAITNGAHAHRLWQNGSWGPWNIDQSRRPTEFSAEEKKRRKVEAQRKARNKILREMYARDPIAAMKEMNHREIENQIEKIVASEGNTDYIFRMKHEIPERYAAVERELTIEALKQVGLDPEEFFPPGIELDAPFAGLITKWANSVVYVSRNLPIIPILFVALVLFFFFSGNWVLLGGTIGILYVLLNGGPRR